MLSTGRKTAKLPRTGPGCLGTSGSERVLHRVHKHPSPVTDPPRDAHLCRDAITGGRGDNRFTEQRGNRGSAACFISQLFLVEKKGGGYRPVVNLKELNQYIGTEHFKMEGLHLLPSLIQQGDEVGLEGCVPSGSNSPTLPPVPTIPMAKEHIRIHVSPIWSLSSTMCVYKVA